MYVCDDDELEFVQYVHNDDVDDKDIPTKYFMKCVCVGLIEKELGWDC